MNKFLSIIIEDVKSSFAVLSKKYIDFAFPKPCIVCLEDQPADSFIIYSDTSPQILLFIPIVVITLFLSSLLRFSPLRTFLFALLPVCILCNLLLRGFEFVFSPVQIERRTRSFISGKTNQSLPMAGLLLKRYSRSCIQEIQTIPGGQCGRIRIALKGCRPFTERLIWLHGIRNLGKVIFLRIRHEEMDKAELLLRSYAENTPAIQDIRAEKPRVLMEQSSSIWHEDLCTMQNHKNASIQHWFVVLFFYWFFTMIAIPVFALIIPQIIEPERSKTACNYLFFGSFLVGVILLLSLKLKRVRFHSIDHIHITLLHVLIAILLLTSLACLYTMREGVPIIINDGYCLWNHRFVRELTKEEYGFYQRVLCLSKTCFSATFSSVIFLYVNRR